MRIFLLTLGALFLCCLASEAQVTLSVSPAYAYITPDSPHGSFKLANEGTQPLEIIASAEYGVIASDSSGNNTGILLGEAGPLGDLTDRLTFFPHRVVLNPGEERVVRYLVEGAEALQPGGYIGLMHYQIQERAAVSEQAIPAIATAISIEYSLVTPLVMISGYGTTDLGAKILDFTEDRIALLLSVGDSYPFVGGISVEVGGEVLGRVTTSVYTRRRVEIPLVHSIDSDEITLHFDNNYPGLSAVLRHHLRAPSPISLSL